MQREHRRNHATGLQWIKVVIALIGVVAGVAPARSQDVPGPIRIIVTGPAGGTPDIIARTTGDRMSAVLGVPVVIENRTGGLGATSIAQQTASAEPDGRTLLQVNTSLFSIGPAIYRKAPFDVHTDFVPISVMATSPNVLVVNANVSATDAKELVTLLRQNPDKLNFGSGGIGTPMHLYGEVLKNQFSLKFTHVPYRGSAPAIVDLLSGQVHILVDQIPSILPHIQSGKLRAIAVANPTRIATLPNVPTFAEAGIDGTDAISWFGLVAPRGTPKAVAERLSAAVQTALKDPAVIAKLQALGASAEGTSSEDMTRHIERQLGAWKPLVAVSGVVID